jgi:probable rRNA maturation factor
MSVVRVGAWRVDVVARPGVRRTVSWAAFARAIARAADAGGAPTPGSVTLVLTDDDELAELNAVHMGHDGPTDVLSFPMLEPASFPPHPGGIAGEPRASAPDAPSLPGRGGRRTHLGDIAISVERAIEQAVEGRGGQTGDVRWSAADELRLLVTHGTLHLCGWDHADPVEAVAMRDLELRLLAER